LKKYYKIFSTLLLSFREKFLTDVLYQKFCGRVLHCVQVGLSADRDVACRVCTRQATPVASFSLLSLTRMCVLIRTRIRVRHAEGMRACTHGATHRSNSVARSTPTAQQERPNKTFINNVLMHHPKKGNGRANPCCFHQQRYV